MANTIHLKLLENKTVAAFFNGMPISYEGGYRIVAGEQNSTDFVIDSVPSQYEGGTIDLYWKNEYNKTKEEKGVEKTFHLPNEMANFGYIQLKITIKIGDEVAVWNPVKMKVWSSDIVTNIKKGVVTSVNGQTGDVIVESGGGGELPSNFVTTNTQQQITGEKVFTNDKDCFKKVINVANLVDGEYLTPTTAKKGSAAYYPDKIVQHSDETDLEYTYTFPKETGILALKSDITGQTITIDEVLDPQSTNPVQNKVINNTIEQIKAQIAEIEQGSGGSITVDDTFDDGSTNPVQNKVITESINDISERLSTIEDEWAEMNYKAPTTSLTLTGDTSDVDLTTESTSRTITGFSHRETNLNNIEGTLTFKKGGTTLQSGIEKKDISTQITLSSADTIMFSSVTSYTYTLSGTSVKGVAFSSSASISSYYPAFYGAYSTKPTDLSALTKIRSLSGTRSITVSGEPQYIWFATTGSISKITSAGFDVPFEQDGTLSYKNGNYKLYRTSEKIIAGTYSYIIS